MYYSRRYRSLFWPALLILIGVVALLVNTGRISGDRLYLLFDLWPLILIVIGLELIVRTAVRGVAAEVAAGLVLLVAIAGALGYVALAPATIATNQSFDASDTTGSLSQASLELDVGAANITVSGGDSLGGDLYHAHIEYSGMKPAVTLDRSTGLLKISQSNDGFNLFQGRRFVLDLQLSPDVTWSFTENSGASTDSLNLASLKLGRMTLNTGASRDDITLGPASGKVSVTINGGALTVNLHRPSRTAASVAVSGGAISLDADGSQQHAIGNVRYESSGFGAASDAYEITVNGGACTVTLDTSSGQA